MVLLFGGERGKRLRYSRRRRRPRYRFRRGGTYRFVIFLAVIAAAAIFVFWAVRSFVPFSCQKKTAADPEVSAAPSIEYVSDTILSPEGTPAHDTRGPEAGESVQAVPARAPQRGTEGSAFIGNSIIDDLYVSGFYPDADYYGKIGLTVRSVFDTPLDNGTVPVIDELDGHDYSEVFVMLGENELGWPATDVFAEEYANVIQKVHEYCPNATVYVMSILPLSAEASARNEDGANMDAVNLFNELLTRVAGENDAVFLDFTSAMKNEDGYLPDEASADGMHLNTTYLKKWAEMIANREEYIA